MTVEEEVANLIKRMGVVFAPVEKTIVLIPLVQELHELRKLKNPIPGSVPEQRLADIRKRLVIDETHYSQTFEIEELFQHIDHLEGLLRDARLDWGEESWRDRIYREGQKSLLPVLKKLEWDDYNNLEMSVCSFCQGEEHSPDCELAKLIQELEL